MYVRSPGVPDSHEVLLQRIGRERDRPAFLLLFNHYAPRLKSYFHRRGAELALAEDLAQETMLQLWRKAPLFDPARGTASAWVFTLARNLHVDALRRDRLAGADGVPTDMADLAPDPEQRAHASKEELRVRAALDELPPAQREVILLSFYGDKAHAAIERELRVPLGTVKSRLRLAIARLRVALGSGE